MRTVSKLEKSLKKGIYVLITKIKSSYVNFNTQHL